MRAKRKYALSLLLFFICASIGGAIFLWHSLDSRFVKDKIDAAISRLPEDVSVSIGSVELQKDFPHITILLDNISVSYLNRWQIKSPQIKDKLSIVHLISSYISGKPYYGNLEIEKIVINHTKSPGSSTSAGIMKIPVLPMDLTIEHLKTNYDNHTLSGTLSLSYLPVSDENRLLFNGNIDNTSLQLKARYSILNIHANLKISGINTHGVSASEIEATVDLKEFKKAFIKIGCRILSYKSIQVSHPVASLKLARNQQTIHIESASLSSSNGYSFKLEGTIDTANPANSALKGTLSTGKFQIKPFIALLGRSIDRYLLDGSINIENLKFYGKINTPESVKSGIIHASNLHFRVNTKDKPFFVKEGTVKITEKMVVGKGRGSFEGIYFDSSSITIHRTKGYPCDMNLKYWGSASEASRLFLQRNILSKSDMKTLGRTKTLSGQFSATTTIKNYYWKPRPYFDFDVKIKANGVSFYNENIPHEFVKAWGDVEIKRETQKGEVKNLFVKLSDLKAKGLFSSASTHQFTIRLKPELYLNGDFKASLSKDDFNFIESQLTNGTIQLNTGRLNIKAALRGPLRDITLSGNLKTTVTMPDSNRSKPLNANFDVRIKAPTITINRCNLNNRLMAHGTLNPELKNFNLFFKSHNLNIADISAFITELPLKAGVVSGRVHLQIIRGGLRYAKGALNIQNGYISQLINSINATVTFNKDLINLLNAKLLFSGNPVNLTGVIRLNRSIRVAASSERLILDLSKIPKTANGGSVYSLRLPYLPVFATANIGLLSIKSGGSTKDISNIFIQLVHNPDNTNLRVESRGTSLLIKRNETHIIVSLFDKNLLPFLTHYKGKNNTLSLRGSFTSRKPLVINLLKLRGNCDIVAKHGEFRNVSNFLKLINITNIFSLLMGKAKVEKHLPYDKIVAHFELKGGILKTRKNTITALYGPNVNIFASGKYNIPQNYLDIYVTLTTMKAINKIISKIPIIGWVIGGKEKSFTGINLHIKGTPGKKVDVKPVPFKALGKGLLNILKRTFMLPLHIFGADK